MKTLASVAFMLLFALQAYAGKVDGTWKATFGAPDGGQGMEMTFKFTTDGDKVTGAIATPQGDMPISNGKITEKGFSFEIDFNGTTMKNTGTFKDDDTITLKAEGMPAPDGQENPGLVLKRQK